MSDRNRSVASSPTKCASNKERMSETSSNTTLHGQFEKSQNQLISVGQKSIIGPKVARMSMVFGELRFMATPELITAPKKIFSEKHFRKRRFSGMIQFNIRASIIEHC
jgi:hypothetical protein